jgi:hypothetical protein
MYEFRVKYRYRGSSSLERNLWTDSQPVNLAKPRYITVSARDAGTAADMVEDMINGCTVIQTSRV